MEWLRQLGWWNSIPKCFWNVIQNSLVPVTTNQWLLTIINHHYPILNQCSSHHQPDDDNFFEEIHFLDFRLLETSWGFFAPASSANSSITWKSRGGRVVGLAHETLNNTRKKWNLVGGFNHLEKYESQWEGLSHIWNGKSYSYWTWPLIVDLPYDLHELTAWWIFP